MADQVDFPDIYIDASAGDGGVGSQADPYNDFSDINWTTGGDNSIYDYYDGSPAASVTINLKKGETWKESISIGAEGTETYPLLIQAYGSGADPIIKGSDLVTTWALGEDTYETIWDAESQTGDSTWASRADSADTSYRLVIENGSITASVSKIKLLLEGDPSDDTVIEKMAIGPKGDGSGEDLWDYEGGVAGTRVQFSGVDNVTVSAGGTATSDPLTFSIDSDTDYLVAYWNGTSGLDVAYLIGSGAQTYYKDSETSDPTLSGDLGSHSSSTSFRTVSQILGATAESPENVWEATLASEPDAVWMDGTWGNKKGSAALCVAEYDWFWSGGTLYIYAATDPDTRYTSPGVEAGQRDQVITGAAKNYITIDGLTIQQSNSVGISNYTAGTNWVIQNCTFTYNKNAPIVISSGGVDCTIDNITTQYNRGTGIAVSSTAGSAEITGLTITGCTLSESIMIAGDSDDAAGIKAFNMHDSLITGNSIFNNDDGAIRFDGGTASGGWGCDDNIIEYNLMYGNGTTAIKWVGNIQIEFSPRNIIRYNHIYDGVDTSSLIIAFARSTGNVIFGNVLHGTDLNYEAAIKTQSNSSGTLIYNNTIYDSDIGIYLDDDGSSEVKNNIVDGSTNYDLLVGTDALTDLDSDYNCFSSDGSHTCGEYGGSDYTLAQWQSAKSQDANSIEQDPLLTNPGAGDFTLQAASPCIGAGVDLGDTYKLALHPDSSWPDSVSTLDMDTYGWVIGAFGYQSALDLVIQDMDHAVALEAPAVSTIHGLIVADMDHVVALESPVVAVVSGTTGGVGGEAGRGVGGRGIRKVMSKRTVRIEDEA